MDTSQSDVPIAPCYTDLHRFVLDHSNYDANKKVLIDALDSKKYVTKRDARNKVGKMISGLHARGLRQGDTVCIVHPNHVLYPIIFLGIVGAGGRYTGANPSYTVTELEHHLRISETNFVITDSKRLPNVREAGSKLLIQPTIFLWDDEESTEAQPFISIHHILFGAFAEPKNFMTFDNEEKSKTTEAALMSTSGTTGMPKMAAKSHHSWVMESLAIEDDSHKPYKIKRLLFTPFFHAFTAPLALISALRCGHTTYVLERFDTQLCLELIRRHNITEVAMPPSVLLTYLELQPEARRALKSIRLVWTGGAAMSAEVQNRARTMFHKEARIIQVYGMTEGGWMSTFRYADPDDTGSVGRLLPTYDAKLVSSDGTATEPDTPGDLWVRGPQTMMHYLNNARETHACLDSGGWLDTGDVATLSPGGKLYILNRKKDILKVRGWQVSPTELEARLLNHTSVVDAAVIGVGDRSSGSETPKAYVVLRDGLPASEEKAGEWQEVLRRYMLEGLAKYKVMDLVLCFRGRIPKSVSGKTLKKLLKEESELEEQGKQE